MPNVTFPEIIPATKVPWPLFGDIHEAGRVGNEVFAAEDGAIEREMGEIRPQSRIDDRHFHALAERAVGVQRGEVHRGVVDGVGIRRGGRRERADLRFSERADVGGIGLDPAGQTALFGSRIGQLNQVILPDRAELRDAADRGQR